MVSRSPTTKRRPTRCVVEHAPRGARAVVELGDHGRIGILGERAHETQRRRVAGELVVVPEQPAQDLATLHRVGRPEALELLGEVVQDDARLRNHRALVQEHRNLAHDVDLAVRRLLRLAAEIIDEARLPSRAGELQRQRGLVRVARLREAVQRVFGRHVTSLRWRASARSARTGRGPRRARRR